MTGMELLKLAMAVTEAERGSPEEWAACDALDAAIDPHKVASVRIARMIVELGEALKLAREHHPTDAELIGLHAVVSEGEPSETDCYNACAYVDRVRRARQEENAMKAPPRKKKR